MLNKKIHLSDKTPYSAIKPIVLSIVNHYQDDFLKIDRKVLQKRDCKECILIARDSGTYLLEIDQLYQALEIYQNDFYGWSPFLFGNVKNSELVYKCYEGQIETIEFTKRNHEDARFFYYDQTRWKEITAETALYTVTGFYARVNQLQKEAA
jgi:hypothetical protein